MEPIRIDGAQGEGGGQILRSSLALSLATGRPLAIENIRAGREKPGMLRQHLTAVLAAARIGGAATEGAAIGARTLRFAPTESVAGDHEFAIGTAGSTTLVLQTILFALVGADRPSRVRLSGGTHNPFAPPFDFLARSYAPLLRRMGAEVELELERPGFHPAGGGAISARVTPHGPLRPLDLLDRGEVRAIRAAIWISALPVSIAEREAEEIARGLGIAREAIEVRSVVDPVGPGNAVVIEIETESHTEVFTGFGRVGSAAEKVAREVVDEARRYLARSVPVGPHLADQLLLPLALAGGGSFRTCAPTRHTRTHADLIERFLPLRVRETQHGRHDHVFEVEKR